MTARRKRPVVWKTQPSVEFQPEPYRLTITVPGRPVMNQAHLHWRAVTRESEHWRRLIYRLVPRSLHGREIENSRVHFDCFRNGAKPDRVNLEHAHKNLLDAIQPSKTRNTKKGPRTSLGCGVIVEDKTENCVDTYLWHRAKRGEDSVVITIEEA